MYVQAPLKMLNNVEKLLDTCMTAKKRLPPLSPPLPTRFAFLSLSLSALCMCSNILYYMTQNKNTCSIAFTPTGVTRAPCRQNALRNQ